MSLTVVSLVVLTVQSAPSDVGWAEVGDLLAEHDGTRALAAEALGETADPSLLAGLNDVLYYYYVVRRPDRAAEISAIMESIAGEKPSDNPRFGWAEWVGRHDEIEPKKGYLAFKRSVFERYDPAFRGYLHPRFVFRIRPEEIEWGGVPKDGIPALDRPGFYDASKAEYLDDGERVFGVYLNGVAKAYPHLIMDPHEMCNDVVGGIPVSLSYCTLCGSGVLYRGDHPSREGKEPFTFGSSGLLYRSNKLMYDRPTNSLWNNLTGEPVAGRLAESGIRLEMLPIVVSTWGKWKERHPDTLVLDVTATGFSRDYSKSPYESYFASEETMFPVWLRSEALKTKQQIFALIVNGRPKAYPLDVLRRERITHDNVGSKPVLLVTSAESGAVRAYETTGKRFTLVGDGALEEVGTGERWDVREDHLLSESGEELRRLPGHNAFWFGWYAFYPTTEIYQQESP